MSIIILICISLVVLDSMFLDRLYFPTITNLWRVNFFLFNRGLGLSVRLGRFYVLFSLLWERVSVFILKLLVKIMEILI